MIDTVTLNSNKGLVHLAYIYYYVNIMIGTAVCTPPLKRGFHHARQGHTLTRYDPGWG